MEKELEILAARVNFCESCVNILKKDVPKYMSKNADLNNSVKHISASLKDVASSEPNQQLQDIIFQYASRYDTLEQDLESYKLRGEQAAMMLDDMKAHMTAPLREVMQDCHNALNTSKKIAAATAKAGYAAVDKESAVMPDKLHMLHTSLPIHTSLFEQHRLRSMHALLASVVHTELSHHIRAVEELSPVMEMLAQFEQDHHLSADRTPHTATARAGAGAGARRVGSAGKKSSNKKLASTAGTLGGRPGGGAQRSASMPGNVAGRGGSAALAATSMGGRSSSAGGGDRVTATSFQ